MNKTFEHIIERLEYISLTGNSYLKSFNWGYPWEIDSYTTLQYPSIFIDCLTREHEYTNGVFNFNFDIYIFDLVEEDSSDLKYVLNDTQLAGMDLINYLINYSSVNGFKISKRYLEMITFNLFKEKWGNLVAGVKFQMKLQVPDGGDLCKNIFA